MIRQIASFPLLQGARGRPKVDLDEVAMVILRISQMADDWPQIDQIDINPLVGGGEDTSLAAIDARIILSESRTGADSNGH